MAWRIQDRVTRGEIDNRERGIVLGKLWLLGREQPIELILEGNCWRDVAGTLLVFENSEVKDEGPPLEGFADEQRGKVGDMTASRKV
ncbi:MAG: hypothetical protein ACI8W8_003361 [Rhodothermales bacterium]|jgi:hypothetical protein